MFEKLLVEARRVVVIAQEQARVMHHDAISTEHILLTLLAPEAIYSSRALQAHDVNYLKVREYFANNIPLGTSDLKSHIPFTPRCKTVLELAVQEAKSLHHDYVSSGHILLGLLRSNKGTAIDILKNLDVDVNALRRTTVGLLSEASSNFTKEQPSALKVDTSYEAQSRSQLRVILENGSHSREQLAEAIDAITDTLDESQLNRIIGILKQ